MVILRYLTNFQGNALLSAGNRSESNLSPPTVPPKRSRHICGQLVLALLHLFLAFHLLLYYKFVLFAHAAVSLEIDAAIIRIKRQQQQFS
jgi:hypothetical protein